MPPPLLLPLPSPPFFHLYGVGGASPNDLWAMGNLGVVYRSNDGATWTEAQHLDQTIEAMISTPSGVLAAGRDGMIMRLHP